MSRFSPPTRPLPFIELVILLAALMSMMAFSIDSIMPAIPALTAAFSPDDPTRAQLTISAFVLGTGVGQFFIGPFSDSFGRRPALVLGIGMFVAGAIWGAFATSLPTLLAARAVQGLGAAGSRVISQSVMRDMFSGREQARISSLIFSFFIVVPALAPFIGQHIIAAVGWRGLFGAYIGMGLAILAWYMLRQPETLAPDMRRPFRLEGVLKAMIEVLSHRVALRYLIVMTLGFGQLMAYLSSAQAVYVDTLGVGEDFPLYFAGVALLSGTSGFVNARLVMRLGMRTLAKWAFAIQVLVAAPLWLVWHLGLLDNAAPALALWLFVGWSVTLFFMNGLTFGNVIALAMEPMGHIAGTASAVLGALNSILAVGIAAPIGLAFDGTPRALIGGVAICSTAGLVLVWTDRHRERAQASAH